MPSSKTNQATNNVESDGKRKRGVLSCAECRRLKLRCDRQVPCGSCIKRGCSSVCPDGSLIPGVGTRLVLNNTQELHLKIQQLSERIRQLEEALEALTTSSSTNPHPLLANELLLIKAAGVCQNDGSQSAAAEYEDILNEAVGTLTIGADGRAEWYGGNAGAEFLFDEEPSLSSIPFSELPHDLAILSGSFPFSSTVSQSALRRQLWSFLPPREYSWKLCEYFFKNAAWLYACVTKDRFIKDSFNTLYDETQPHPTPVFDHHLALVFIIMGIGILLDLDRLPYDPEAIKCLQLSRCALALNGVLDNCTIPAVQALQLMSMFEQLSNDPSGAARGWSIAGITVKLAQSIGLHRDSARWNLDPGDVQLRRQIWWEIMTFETWLSFACGRPPSVAHHHSDCEIPRDDGATVDANGEVVSSFARVKLLYTYKCVREVADQAFAPKPPSYAKVLELDSRIRNFTVHGIMKTDTSSSLQSTLTGYLAMSLQEIVLLYLHRRALVQAIKDKPTDPLQSIFAPSVLAAYRASCAILSGLRLLQSQQPVLAPRFFQAWVHAVSAFVVLGAIIIQCPRCSLASPALVELNLACELFTAASEGYRPAKALPMLLRIRNSAQEAIRAPDESDPRPEAYYDFSALSGVTRLKKRPLPAPVPEALGQGTTGNSDAESSMFEKSQHQNFLPSNPQPYFPVEYGVMQPDQNIHPSRGMAGGFMMGTDLDNILDNLLAGWQ